MSSVNKVILIGRLGKEPDTRYLANGDAVTNVSLATEEVWKDRDGNKQTRTEWHKITVYRKLAEIVGEYLKKGSQVYFEGRLETRKWTDKNGIDRYTTEIIVTDMKMLGSRPAENKQDDRPPQPDGVGTGFDGSETDDIPF